jgi:ubiquinone/menaquinone biosynthesis C-methylase UbiE
MPVTEDRLYAMYFDKVLAKTPGNVKLKLLDIAPSGLEGFLRNAPAIEYRSADLYKEGVDDKVDITDMNIYENERFDIFVCSHVLEHVKEAKTAMKELYRVLKRGGWGIAMVPIALNLTETLERSIA